MTKNCKQCHKPFEVDDGYSSFGSLIPKGGVANMGFGSKYDLNWYVFTLVPGWYCFDCLDKEILHGLCQPLRIWVKDPNGSLGGGSFKTYPVKGVTY